MTVAVTIDGFPPVVEISVYQPSDARPGRIIVKSAVAGPENVLQLPRVTNLTITVGSWVGTWSDIRMCQSPRVRCGYMHTVFEDSRWKLRDTLLSDNHNYRDTLGTVLTAHRKSLTELIDIVKDKSGLDIVAGTLPSFDPPARWANVDAQTALQQLLERTGCRFVYDPLTEQYTYAQAGTGTAINTANRIFRPAPEHRIRDLIVRSHPVVKESRMAVKACKINRATGALEALASPIHLATSPNDLEKQTILRLWAPFSGETIGDDTKVLLPYRAKAHVYDPEHWSLEQGRVIRDGWEPEPYHQPFYRPIKEIEDALPITFGGKVFVTEHPVMMTDSSGELLDEATLLTGYYERDGNGDFVRESKTVSVDGSASNDLTITLPWIRPVQSSEIDMSGGSAWDTLHQSAADAIATAYGGEKGVVVYPVPFSLSGSGHVGGQVYKLSLKHFKADIRFMVALNFVPGSVADIE